MGQDLGVEVINFGIEGAKVTSLLAMFKEELVNYDLDIFIIYEGINNYYDVIINHFEFYKFSGKKVSRIKNKLIEYSLFCMLLNEKIAVMKGNANLAYYTGSQEIVDFYPQYIKWKKEFDQEFNNAEKAYAEFARFAKANNIKVVFVLQVLNNHVYDKKYEEEGAKKASLTLDELRSLLHARMNKIITEVGKKESVPVINTEGELGGINYDDIFLDGDYVHPNKKGAKLLADIIASKLKAMKITGIN